MSFPMAPGERGAAHPRDVRTAAEAMAEPGRRLVLIGGGLIPESIFREMLRLGTPAGRHTVQVLVCPLASGDPEAGRTLQAAFEENAAKVGLTAQVRVVDFLPPAFEAPGPELALRKWENLGAMRALSRSGHGLRELCEADVLFFSGGDQRLILETLRGSPFEETMLARWSSRELLVAGTSAGLQVCSELALTGDLRASERGDGPYRSERTPGPDAPGVDDIPLHRIAPGPVVTARGFPLLKGVILDQHFIRRQRQNRLFSACLDNPGFTGLGVDESTALVVEEQGTSGHGRPRVVGDSCVFYVDTLLSTLQNSASGSLLAATDLRCGMVWDGGLFPFTLSLA